MFVDSERHGFELRQEFHVCSQRATRIELRRELNVCSQRATRIRTPSSSNLACKTLAVGKTYLNMTLLAEGVRHAR